MGHLRHSEEVHIFGRDGERDRRRLMTSRRRRSQRTVTAALPAPVADRGLLDRRAFLTGAVQVAGLVALGHRAGDLVATAQAAESPTLETPPWMKIPGQPFRGYGQPATYEAEVKR